MKTEILFQESTLSIPEVVRQLLKLIDPDPERIALKKTPQRFAKTITELTAGYAMDPKTIANGAVYPAKKTHSLIVVNNIAFYSLCEHHLLPFFGKVHIGYIPNKKIIGLSKIPRIVQVFSRRLQLQERLIEEIARSLEEILEPLGIGVIARARHMCLEMRGAKAKNSEMLTSFYSGKMRERPSLRKEFFNLLSLNSQEA